MRPIKGIHLAVLAACALMLLPVVQQAAAQQKPSDFEVPGSRQAKDIIGAGALKGEHYRIRDLVLNDGYTDRWTVDSDYGAFEVAGDGALRKLLVEIRALAELQKVKKSKAYVDGLKGAVKAPIELTKSLITNPVDTVTGVPKGFYALMENVGTSATSTQDPSEDARYAQALKMSSFKRDYADKLDVDVYSSNKVLQKELNSVAWASTVGDLTFSVAMLPAGVGGSVASNVRIANSVKNAVKYEPPARLRIINGEKLEKIGIPEDLRKRYLDHPAFTPYHDTVIAANLEALNGVAGLDNFLSLAVTAEDETQANFYTAMAQMLRGYHETVAKLTRISVVGRFTVAQTAGGQAFIALPVDRLVWTSRVFVVSDSLKSSYKQPDFNGKFDLWVMGTLSPRARQELENRNFTVVEKVNTRVEILD